MMSKSALVLLLCASCAEAAWDPTLITRAAEGETSALQTNFVAASRDGLQVLVTSGSRDLLSDPSPQILGYNAYVFDAGAAAMHLVSHADGEPGREVGAEVAVMSENGRWIAFSSWSADVVAVVEDVGPADVFLLDRSSGQVSLAVHAHGFPNRTPDSGARPLWVSDDGRRLVVSSESTNLTEAVLETTRPQLYVVDRLADTATLVTCTADSMTASDDSHTFRDASSDGEWILFDSSASDLVSDATDENYAADTFLFRSSTRAIRLISRSVDDSSRTALAGSTSLGMSDDGRKVLLQSESSDLVTGLVDTNDEYDVFLFDREANLMTLVSRSVSVSGSTAANGAMGSAISDNGRWLTFGSRSVDLVTGVTNPGRLNNVYLHDVTSDSTFLVSDVPGAPGVVGNAQSFGGQVSEDGRLVMFSTLATDLLNGVTHSGTYADVIRLDRSTGNRVLVSRRSQFAEIAPNGSSSALSLSADGSRATFRTEATDILGSGLDNNAVADLFSHRVDADESILISRKRQASVTGTRSNSSRIKTISPDGRWVLFDSDAPNLVPDQRNPYEAPGWIVFNTYVFLHDTQTGATTLVSRAFGTTNVTPSSTSEGVGMSDDGRWVLYQSAAVTIPEEGVSNGINVYLFDRETGTTTLVTHRHGEPGMPADESSRAIQISADARWILFDSFASDLVDGMSRPTPSRNVFLHDRLAGETRLVSHVAGNALVALNESSDAVAMSADSEWIFVNSAATDVASGVTDANQLYDAFAFRRSDGARFLVAPSAVDAKQTAEGGTFASGVSDDGRRVLLYSLGVGVIEDGVDANGLGEDVFLVDRQDDVATLISRAADDANRTADSHVQSAFLSADGSTVVFDSYSQDHVADVIDGNAGTDVYRYDVATGTLSLLTHASNAPLQAASRASTVHGVSADGARVLVESRASNLVAGVVDANGSQPDAFVFDPSGGRQSIVASAASPGRTPRLGTRAHAIGRSGDVVGVASSSEDLVPGYVNDQPRINLYFLREPDGPQDEPLLRDGFESLP